MVLSGSKTPGFFLKTGAPKSCHGFSNALRKGVQIKDLLLPERALYPECLGLFKEALR